MAIARSHIWLVCRVCWTTVEQIMRFCTRMWPQVGTHTDIRLDGSIFDGCHAQKHYSQNVRHFWRSWHTESRIHHLLANNAIRFRRFGFVKKCQNRNIAQNAVECPRVLLSMPFNGSTDSTLSISTTAAAAAVLLQWWLLLVSFILVKFRQSTNPIHLLTLNSPAYNFDK